MQVGAKISSNIEKNFNEFLKEYGPKDTRKVYKRALKLTGEPVLDVARGLVARDSGELASLLKVVVKNASTTTFRSEVIRVSSDLRHAVGHAFIGFFYDETADKNRKPKWRNFKAIRFTEELGANGRPPKRTLQKALHIAAGGSVEVFRRYVGREMERTANRLSKNKLSARERITGKS